MIVTVAVGACAAAASRSLELRRAAARREEGEEGEEGKEKGRGGRREGEEGKRKKGRRREAEMALKGKKAERF